MGAMAVVGRGGYSQLSGSQKPQGLVQGQCTKGSEEGMLWEGLRRGEKLCLWEGSVMHPSVGVITLL